MRYIPTVSIGSLLGGEDIGTIILTGSIGVPVYLDGYALGGRYADPRDERGRCDEFYYCFTFFVKSQHSFLDF